uniref:Protein kinase domain-containing protein n=1 Tax=Parascaris univalens TaxID=6257 RepID=A0A915A616_PARUN
MVQYGRLAYGTLPSKGVSFVCFIYYSPSLLMSVNRQQIQPSVPSAESDPYFFSVLQIFARAWYGDVISNLIKCPFLLLVRLQNQRTFSSEVP